MLFTTLDTIGTLPLFLACISHQQLCDIILNSSASLLSLPHCPSFCPSLFREPYLPLITALQEDLDGDDNWSIAMAGATCLEAMARTIEDGIVPLILPFVTQVPRTNT
jgi:hypothetical protein